MAIDQLTDQLETQTTRRTIVKTGAKLAYAAPLVAVSFKLSGRVAGAVTISPNSCIPTGGDACSQQVACQPGADVNICGCGPTPEGHGFCFQQGGCGAACSSSSQCSNGQVCVATCCGFACQDPCADAAVDVAAGVRTTFPQR